MQDRMAAALKGHNADYVEIRIEETESTYLEYRGPDLDNIGRNASLGGNVRALVKGAWGFVSFNEPGDLRKWVELAVAQARLAGKESSALAPVDPVQDIVEPVLKASPASVELAHKKALLDEYNGIILGTPGIQTSNISYGDSQKKVIFVSSEGTRIQQGKVDVSARFTAMARDGSDVQQCGLSLGSIQDFGVVEGLQAKIADLAKRAVALLKAPTAKGGEYTVVCDPILAGVFAHEAFGHLSESDFVYENDHMRQIMVLGKRFGQPHLNIVDGAAVPGLRGSYKYDDEGVKSTKTYLITEGVLTGRLHSRETAARMGEKPTGNARAMNYQFQPIVRMSNTYIEPGKTAFDEMISDIKEGIYARNWYGGTTSMEMFTFSAGEAYMIRNGKVEEMVRPIVLTGNVFQTLENIDAVGRDLEMSQGGGCGKGGQMPLPVSDGGPHIRIRKCLVGGK